MKNSFKLFDPMRDYSSILPDIPGNYLVVLRTSSLLPQIEVLPEFHYIDYNNNHYPIIYTGISTVSIRKRDYQQHFIGNNAGKSTLRKSLGSLMGFPKFQEIRTILIMGKLNSMKTMKKNCHNG